ncbi:glycosyltransferase family 2 protein [Collinsella tanakaei]|nr:glycosyltransferase family 2 protein [Collinsella tanakaei]
MLHERVGAPRTVAFVIITWNSELYVKACLESVLGLGELCFAVYVVDNGSEDATLRILEDTAAKDARLHVLPQAGNIGTTRSRNIAIREVLDMEMKPGYVCVLDSDTVVNARAIEEVIDVMERDSTIGVAGPTLVGADGAPQLSGRNLPTLPIKLMKACPISSVQSRGDALEKPSAPIKNGIQDVGYLISACWITPISSWERVGLLDEKIFYAPEDVDWCLRCHMAGLRVVRVRGHAIKHYYQRISKKRLISRANIEHVKGLACYFRKHGYLIHPPLRQRNHTEGR